MSTSVSIFGYSNSSSTTSLTLCKVVLGMLSEHRTGRLPRSVYNSEFSQKSLTFFSEISPKFHKNLEYRLFYALKVLWDHCSEFSNFVNDIRASPEFWSSLNETLDFERSQDTQTLMCQAFVLHLLSVEVNHFAKNWILCEDKLYD